MEIEVPEFFIVSNCSKCETRHAPVRDCPTRFVPSTEELLHWIHYGIDGCPCAEVCVQMRRLSDQDN
jgi:hypothetical protein